MDLFFLILITSIVNLLIMSLSKNSTFFKQYAKSGYIQKINPEFQGIARKLYNEKHEHEKVHIVKKKLDQEVAYIQRLEKKMSQQLQKKKHQLKYTKQVSSRFMNDLRRKQWLQEYHEKEIKNNKEKYNFRKTESLRKIQEAKQFLTEQKRSLANLNRNDIKKVKQQKSIKRAKEWDSNRSRVSEINQFKKEVKQSTNKFYKKRNDSSLSNYKQRIQSYKKYSAFDSNKIKDLQNMKNNLKEKFNRDKQQADQIAKQIERIKNEAKLENSLVRSQVKSRSHSSLSVSSQKGTNHKKHKSEFEMSNKA